MNALMKETKTIELLQVGSRVHCTLYGGKDGTIYNINGEQRPETVRTLMSGCMTTGGNATFDIVWDNGIYSIAISESLIRSSVQWRIYPDVKRSLIEIDMAKRNADNAIKAEEDKAAEAAKQRELNCEIMRLSKPHLKEIEKYSGGKQCAKNIRIELKRAFKGVKFSVRSDYSSVNISWTDGPTDEQVEAIANKYEEGRFNGMEDIYEYNASPFNDVFGGVQYVFTRRDNSDAAAQRAIDAIFDNYKYDLKGLVKPSVEDFNNGSLYNVEIPGFYQPLSRVIHGQLSKTAEV